jgi:hypothetical protein
VQLRIIQTKRVAITKKARRTILMKTIRIM